MKMNSIFDANDFRTYLTARFATLGASRGLRTQLAALIGVRPSYVTMILSGELQLNLDHLPAINQILEHTEQESEFLLQLVLYNQSGNKEMKDYCKKKIDAILESREVDAEWIGDKKEITEEQQAKFVSAWYYSVIYVLTNIPSFQTKSSIAERLHLSLRTVTEGLEFLVKIGLVEEKGSRFKMTSKRLHFKKTSTWTSHYHTNVRQLVLRSLTEPLPEDLHYSFVMSVSNSDKEKIKKKLIAMIAEIEPIIADSKDEDASALSLDFFRI